MKREALLQRLADTDYLWDVIVIGGGATGLGTAMEAASRGYRTLLLEQHDFSSGTSSRSTKLIHGGVRYLKQGNLTLVLEALYERGLLIRNAPHLVHNLAFIVPIYDWWEGPFYGIGLKFYDLLAGRLGLGSSRQLTREETIAQIPTVEPEGLHGGVIYHDAQFDDARLAICLALTLLDLGGTPLNYMEVGGLLKSDGLISGVKVRDQEGGREYSVRGRVVVNATGVFADSVLRMDDPDSSPVITASQGIHLVLDRTFLPGECAVMVPHTDDGRVLFALPWHGRTIVGTTDTPVDNISSEPCPLEEEIEFLLTNAARYLAKHPTRQDILSVFAGLRPLVKASEQHETAALSREHSVMISSSGLVTITGGKWTTFRRMGEDTVDRAAEVAGLEPLPSVTANLKIHGWCEKSENDPWGVYGSDADQLRDLAATDPAWLETLHPSLPYRVCEVIWAVRKEFARTVEDVLARRTRALFLDAKASMAIAPRIAQLIAGELGYDDAWKRRQVDEFMRLAASYLP
ncbi:MAG: glycerol-3-phosphate dehydrogenase/oxidase [Deltaproteobacteria bacterium]